MRKDTGRVFKIEDYRPCDYRIVKTSLTFALASDTTMVTAELDIERADDVTPLAPLILDGDELTLVSLTVDGSDPAPGSWEATPQRLTISRTPAARHFRVSIVTRLEPSNNGTLMGLFRSSGVWCTQCEPEGFRRITVGSSRVDLQACKLEYSIVSPK